MEKDIFISYCWTNEKETDEIDLFFKSKGIGLKRDKRNLEYKQSIKEFMKTIRKMDFIILVISDEYLKSFNCMYEVLEFLKDEDYKKRILPVIIDNANIYGAVAGIDYIKYWNNELLKLDNSTEGLSSETIIPILENKKRIKKIQDSIVDFIDEISDMNHYKFEELKNIKYEPLLREMNIEQIKNKVLYYDVLKQEDVSHAGAKRYSVKILVNSKYYREDIKMVLKQVIDEIKQDTYYRNELVKNQFGNSVADIVTVFVYYRNSDEKWANYICRAVWNAESLNTNFRFTFNGTDEYENIEIDWNNNYQEDISMYKPATKGKYLSILDDVEKEISLLAKDIIDKIEKQLITKVDFAKLGNLREKHLSDFEIIREKKDNIPLPPLECDDLDNVFEGLYIFLHNIFIWISEKNLSERTEQNIGVLLKQKIKNYKSSIDKFQSLRKSI